MFISILARLNFYDLLYKQCESMYFSKMKFYMYLFYDFVVKSVSYKSI